MQIHAAALNFRDLLVTADSPLYPIRTSQGLTPCSDGAGVVEAVRENSKWEVGDRVILMPNQSWLQGDNEQDFDMPSSLGGGTVQGTLRQHAVVKLKMPSNLSFEEAAALPKAGATAVNALFHGPGAIKSGHTVPTQGTAGVSCFAIQVSFGRITH